MPGTIAMNATSALMSIYSMNSLTSGAALSVITLLLAFAIGGAAFLLFRNFRRFLYGLVVLVPISIIIYISHHIAKKSLAGDYGDITILAVIIGVIVVSIFIGVFVERWGWFKNIEFSDEDMNIELKTKRRKGNAKSNPKPKR